MDQTPPRRLSALLLALIFVVGGFGATDLDALLYHSGAHATRDVTHVDRPGGCGGHAEHCVLAAGHSMRQLGATVAAALRINAEAPPPPSPTPQPARPSADRPLPHQSRAPPAAVS